MRAPVTGVTEREFGLLPASAASRPAGRSELAAGLATAIVVAQLLFAPLVLLGCGLLTAAGWLSRWRPHWLALPASAGVAWLLEAGLHAPVTGLAAGSRLTVRLLAALALHPARLGSLTVSGGWLAAQLPLALLAASAEAAAVLFLARRRSPPDWRPGLLVAVRRRSARAAFAAGEVVTRHGFAVGLDSAAGRLAGLSWPQAAGGILVTGADPAALAGPCLAAACAAIRRRKTVLVLDLAPAAGPGLAAPVAELAARLGVAVTSAGAEPPATVIGRAIRCRGVAVMPAGAQHSAARLAGDLTGVLASLRDLRLRADCLTVISGCEAVPPGPLTALLRLGPETGTGLVLATANPASAASLWPFTVAGIAAGPVDESLAVQLAGRAAGRLTAQPRGRVTLLAQDEPPGRRLAARPAAGLTQLPIEIGRIR
jgi:hypothetical protein